MTNENAIVAYTNIPYNVFNTELAEGSARADFNKEIQEIMGYYNAYKKGVEFSVENNGDYVPSQLHYKEIRDLIDKEARFLFSVPPTFTVNPDNTELSAEQKEQNTQLNDFLIKVLKKVQFNSKLVKAAKDCFIGKRVACMLNFNETEGISVSFLQSTEFLYEMKGSNLRKIVGVIVQKEASNKAEQVILKKVYEMGDDGYCYVEETLYDGLGSEKEEGKVERTKTLFQSIPAVVIFNDGLSNDGKGESDVGNELEYEESYNRLANSDIDAERKSMNPIRYTLDASSESTEGLSVAPGAFWDLQTDQTGSDPKTAKVGMLEAGMNYSAALKVTLDRLENKMYSQLEIPNITSEKLQGVITSGKTLKALYWSLIVRCNEKMLVWGPALEYIASLIVEGALLYPESARVMSEEQIPDSFFEVKVENNYPLPEDEAEEKAMDLAEVSNMTMSRLSYMKKWRELTDEEAMNELKQIALERQLLEDSFSSAPGGQPEQQSIDGQSDETTDLDDENAEPQDEALEE